MWVERYSYYVDAHELHAGLAAVHAVSVDATNLAEDHKLISFCNPALQALSGRH